MVAADEVYFQLPELKRGLFPFQVMASLSTILSERTLIDFCITGRKMEASEAEKLGLVTKMVDDLNLQDETGKLVESLKLNSPNAKSREINNPLISPIKTGLAFNFEKWIPSINAGAIWISKSNLRSSKVISEVCSLSKIASMLSNATTTQEQRLPKRVNSDSLALGLI